MIRRIILWGGISILVVGLAALVWWLMRPQEFTLAGGTRLSLVAVTYGRHHASPATKSQDRPHRVGFEGTNDFLVVWVRQQHNPNQWPAYQLFAEDLAGTACVGSSAVAGNVNRRRGDETVGFRFDAFPRRQRKFILRLQEWNPQSGRQTITNAFVISNPARRSFPAWYPDALPDTQTAGDLDVTLTKLAFGAKMPYQRNDLSPDDPMNQGVLAGLEIQKNGETAPNWRPVRVVTSDATGNHVSAAVNSFGQDEGRVLLYQFGLWPEEPAWKVQVELSRQTGFSENELWTAQNVPLQPGRMQDFMRYGHNRANPAFAETTLNGLHLKVYPAMQFTDRAGWFQAGGGFEIQADKTPEGTHVTLVKVTDDQGRVIPTVNWNLGGNLRFGLGNLGNAQTLNLTFAVHQSRFIEFTVKPLRQ